MGVLSPSLFDGSGSVPHPKSVLRRIPCRPRSRICQPWVLLGMSPVCPLTVPSHHTLAAPSRSSWVCFTPVPSMTMMPRLTPNACSAISPAGSVPESVSPGPRLGCRLRAYRRCLHTTLGVHHHGAPRLLQAPSLQRTRGGISPQLSALGLTPEPRLPAIQHLTWAWADPQQSAILGCKQHGTGRRSSSSRWSCRDRGSAAGGR